MRTRPEPILWGLFAAGGMVAALLYPAHLFATCLLVPAGLVDAPAHADAQALFGHPLFRAYLVVLVALPLFHAAHRIKAAFMDFGLRPYRRPATLLLYGGAAAGFAFALWSAVTM